MVKQQDDTVVKLSKDDTRWLLRWFIGVMTSATMIIVGAGWRFSVTVTTAIEQGRYERAAMHERLTVIEHRIENLPTMMSSN